MVGSMDYDFSAVDKLAADLGETAKGIGPFARKAVEVSARHVKDDWKSNVASSDYFPGLESAVSYDVHVERGGGGGTITGEVGYDRDRPQGNLGHIAEFGGVKNAPRSDGQNALQSNQEDFITGLEKAEEDARKRYGL